MASRNWRPRTKEREFLGNAVEQLRLAQSERLADLLVLLGVESPGSETGTAGIGKRRADGRPGPVLAEEDVDGLLSNEARLRERLQELEALDVAAEEWQAVLADLREALELYARNPDETSIRALEVAAVAAAQRRRARNRDAAAEPLCEADDEYWYL